MNKNIINIALASDHAGFPLKTKVKEFLQETGIEVNDFGTHSEESTDYADYVHPLAKSVEAKENTFGIVICGSGNGVNITANKHQQIRSALCWNVEIASLARRHNDANVLAMAGRFIDTETAISIVETFLSTEFEGGRHTRRVNKIPCL